jgi:hypothetical protein
MSPSVFLPWSAVLMPCSFSCFVVDVVVVVVAVEGSAVAACSFIITRRGIGRGYLTHSIQ